MALPSSVRPALAVALLVTAAAALHGVSPTTSDPDGLYHVRHAWVYRTQGLLDSAFPWAAFSAIRDEASDLWYGFHLLLVPLTLPANLLHGVLAGSVLVTAAALVLVFLAFGRLGLAWPLAWVALFAAVGDVLFRLSMLRPQPLSLGLALLALALLAVPPRRGRLVALGVVSLLAAWIHLALAWLVPLVALAYAATRVLQTRHAEWRAAGAALVGAGLGALLRPAPIGALRLAWIQVGLFLDVKRRGLALPFGQELQPLSLGFDGPWLVAHALGLLALAAVVALGLRRVAPADAPRRAAAWTSLALCALFTLLSLRVASRSFELAAAFGAAFLGLAFAELRSTAAARVRTAAKAALVVALVVLLPLAARRYETRVRGARPLLAFRGASLWLAANARPGDRVFHAWWDQFPHLFFWNPAGRYVGGMDPLFQYAHDPSLFWKADHLARDAQPEATCGKPACAPDEAEDTALVLRRDFGAAFVLVHRNLNPRLDAWLAARAGLLRVFDDGTDVVYRVQYDDALPPGGRP